MMSPRRDHRDDGCLFWAVLFIALAGAPVVMLTALARFALEVL
ncbi:MAG: hypothetical protein ACREXX_13965 [Gammaproteobacteria bacterium]